MTWGGGGGLNFSRYPVDLRPRAVIWVCVRPPLSPQWSLFIGHFFLRQLLAADAVGRLGFGGQWDVSPGGAGGKHGGALWARDNGSASAPDLRPGLKYAAPPELDC